MAIEHRDLTPGTVLSARYKQQAYTCTVEENEDHSFAFVLADGRRFKSPSSAGSAVMGGIACNGWRFWSLAGADGTTAATPAEARPVKVRATKLIKRVPNQNGVPEGQVKYFCSGCMDAFLHAADAVPATCPQGHGDAAAV